MTYPENNEPQQVPGKNALPLNDEQQYALDELIATVKATLSFIRFSQMDQPTKKAFYQLEKQFIFYANLVINEKGGTNNTINAHVGDDTIGQPDKG